MKNNPFVSHFVSAEKECDATVLRQVMNAIDDDSASAILNTPGRPDSENYDYLNWRLHGRKPLGKTFHRNESVEELLSLYSNPKSKKVEYARKGLCSRFGFLSYAEQCTIIDTFLKSGNVTDIMFCCKQMVNGEYWKDEYAAIIEPFFLDTFTGNTRNAYAVSKVIVLHSSQQFISESISTLDHQEHLGNLTDTLNVLLIAAEGNPKSLLKHTSLNAADYAYIMAKKGLKISEYEAQAAFDEILTKDYVSTPEIRILSWSIASMGYLDLLLDFGVRLKSNTNITIL